MPYIVTINTPGYLYSEEPSEFDERDEARKYARESKQEFLDNGYELVHDDPDYILLTDPEKTDDLGIAIEVVAVDS